MKVLFVCTGNICRSPAAEIIFKNIVAEKEGSVGKSWVIKSAGTDAWDGEKMTDLAWLALSKCGEALPKTAVTSTRFNPDMIDQFDHIVCMARVHVNRIDPNHHHSNVYMLDERDVADPWGWDIEKYIDVTKHLRESLEKLYDKICKTS